MPTRTAQDDASQWYKDAIIYELHVKSFQDSNDDGIGDFRGLIERLDYLENLGVTAVWLLPFYPSPLRDDGYDIADYLNINPDYGTLKDFRAFLRAAHQRGIRVITELVVNHTSDQHKWFQRARRARPGSIWRDFYVWSETPDKYKDARIIFQDFENSNWTWDPVAQAYYWHRFYSHQPDLNYDNPRVRKEILRVLDFWFRMGVDGMRLDAVPYLFQREGTNCENLPETHAFLKELRAHVDVQFPGRMLLAEANQWPEDAAAYFGDGDECHMAFHFPVMPRLFMALRTEDRFPIIDMLEQSVSIPEGCQWAMFLRNHDELTLEMVTDEERDYMYRVYAQDPRARINVGIRRRLAPLLENSRRRIELMNALLMALPGTPVLYYGDEINMGDNYYLGDRDGVRTPMQWSADRNAGFSTASPQKLFLPVVIDLEYHYTSLNVETQMGNPSSLFWFMRRIIGLRKQFRAFGRGRIEFLSSDNSKVLSFIRAYDDEVLLIVANLSRFCQVVNLEMGDYAGSVVEELFGGMPFPPVGEAPYTLTIGPHGFYWLRLRRGKEPEMKTGETVERIVLDTTWRALAADGKIPPPLMGVLRSYLQRARWFGGKGKSLRRIAVSGHTVLATAGEPAHFFLLRVIYSESPPETYLLAVSFAPWEVAQRILADAPQSVIAEAELPEGEGILYDAVFDPEVRRGLLEIVGRRKRPTKRGPALVGVRGAKYREGMAQMPSPVESRVLKVEQSNTSVVYGNTFFLKLYRRLEAGENPDVEISRQLTEYTDYRNFPPYAGSLQWHADNSDPLTIGLLLSYVRNEGDAWTYLLDAVGRYFQQVLTLRAEPEQWPEPPASIHAVDPGVMPSRVRDLMGGVCLDMVSLLGRRTAELHLALASLSHDAAVRPEPFSMLYQKSVCQSMRALTLRVFGELEKGVSALPDALAADVQTILDARKTVLGRFSGITRRKISALKIRVHGDYHLGQVLYTGKDFVIIDFEGEPARSLGERRLKRSALRDVAGMIRSFHYAAWAAIFRTSTYEEDQAYLQRWADLWYLYVSGVFLQAYLEGVGPSDILPQAPTELQMLLDAFLLEKAVYELGYEFNNRPDWLPIPVRGIQHILKDKL